MKLGYVRLGVVLSVAWVTWVLGFTWYESRNPFGPKPGADPIFWYWNGSRYYLQITKLLYAVSIPIAAVWSAVWATGWIRAGFASDATVGATPGTPRTARLSTSDWFRSLMNGDFGLARTYWLYATLPTAIVVVILAFVASPPLHWMIFLVYVPYIVSVYGGIWRAADRYEGPAVWAGLAKIAVVLGLIRLTMAFLPGFQ